MPELPGELSPGPAYLFPVAPTLELCKSPPVPAYEQGYLLLLFDQNDNIAHMRNTWCHMMEHVHPY